MSLKKPKEGYKLVKSLFGKYEEIPENWQQIIFQQIITNGPSSGLYSPEENYGTGDKIVGLGDIFKADILQTNEMRKVNLSDEEKSRFLLKSYDLVFSRYSLKFEGVGKCLFIPKIHENILFESNTLRVSLSDKVESRYIAYYFNSAVGRHSIIRILKQVSSTGITGTDLKNLKITLPPKHEQQKIASILSNIDSLINQTQKEIEQTQRLKKGLMQKLLTKGIGHTKFKESKFGKIPNSWDVVSFEKFVKIISGNYFPFTEFVEQGIPVLKIDNVMHGQVDWTTRTYLPQKYLDSKDIILLKKNDIVLALNRPITQNKIKVAKLGKDDSPSILYQRVGKFEFQDKERIDQNYFFIFLSSPIFKFILGRILIGSDQPYVKTTELLKQKFPLPPDISEQQKIAMIVSNVDSKIQKQQESKSKLETLKKGLMQKLLTGQIRVRV